MENSSTEYKIILLDSDIISHFIINNAIEDLVNILDPHKCYVLDYVYDEISNRPLRLAFLDAMINKGKIEKMIFPVDIDINKEFAKIKRDNPLIGDGERACMVVARFRENIVASSNFRDVAPYCDEFKILYIGTLDILYIAYQKEIYSEEQCDEFIQNAIKNNKARFPKGVTAIRYYEPKVLDFIY